MAVRGRLDEFQMALGKQVRDALRSQQSALRAAATAAASARTYEVRAEMEAADRAAETADRGVEVGDIETALLAAASLPAPSVPRALSPERCAFLAPLRRPGTRHGRTLRHALGGGTFPWGLPYLGTGADSAIPGVYSMFPAIRRRHSFLR